MSGAAFAAVDRTLARIAGGEPALAARCAAALAPVTGALAASAWPEIATGFSRLTATGYPIEFAWSSRDASVRWTAEVAPPEVAEADRLPRAAAARPMGRLAEVAALQRGRHHRWGAWIGARHGPGGDTAKIYAELPDALPEGWHPRDAPAGLVWRMAGIAPDGTRELYARAPRLDGAALRQAECALIGSDGALAAAACALIGDTDLPRPAGLSIALGPDGAVHALTWFVIAKLVFRDDAAAAARLRTAARDPQAAALYAALADGPGDGRWRHGMIGVGLDRAGRGWVQAGIRPT